MIDPGARFFGHGLPTIPNSPISVPNVSPMHGPGFWEQLMGNEDFWGLLGQQGQAMMQDAQPPPMQPPPGLLAPVPQSQAATHAAQALGRPWWMR